MRAGRPAGETTHRAQPTACGDTSSPRPPRIYRTAPREPPHHRKCLNPIILLGNKGLPGVGLILTQGGKTYPPGMTVAPRSSGGVRWGLGALTGWRIPSAGESAPGAERRKAALICGVSVCIDLRIVA
jgi:hypothetical protein